MLGPLTVWTDAGTVVPVPGAKVRALLADLLVAAGQPVPADRLVDDIWADDPPGNPAGTLAAKASQLRRVLEDAQPGGRHLVVSPPPGYRLAATDVDALRFRALLGAAREADTITGRVSALTEALALWRGPAFADFRDAGFARPAIAQLEEQRLVAVEELAEARLELGAHRAVASDLTAFVSANPLRERLRAAYLRALYGAGRQTEALDSFEDLRSQLADELGLDPSPELVALQRAILGHEPEVAAAQPAAVVRRRVSNIPAQRTALIGRDRDLDALRDAVRHGRQVTLTGPGGVGKTRLALAAAAALTGEFPDGTWLVELAALQPGAGDGALWLAETVAQVLGIQGADGGPDDPVDRLRDALAGQRLLLVLDNCEHVVDHAAELAETLLAAAPELHILATSREQLRLPGEEIVVLEPLAVPTRDTDLGELERFSAVELFVARAKAGARDFVLDADTADAVATLCRRLDGIPLALELAATRVRALGVTEMVARLDDRFRLLATGHRGAPPRQQTLTAMIDWSWTLLDASEQAVLRRLAVHAGGCTLDAAEAVCAVAPFGADPPGADSLGADSIGAEMIADVVARLVDRSLIQTVGQRYRLLESVAAFCLDRLADAGEADVVQQAHREHYLRLAEQAAPELHGADQQRWLRRLDAEGANLRAALDGLLRSGAADPALRLVDALAWYWMLRGRLAEARRWFDAALALGGSPARRAPALAWRTAFAFQQSEFTDAPARRAEVFSAYTALDDPAGLARAQVVLAFSALESGDTELQGLIERALPECERLGDRWGTALAHVALANCAHATVDLAALEHHSRSATRMFTEIGDRWGRLRATEWSGGLAELTGDLSGAADIHTEALRLAQELELWGQVCAHLAWLGWTATLRTDYDGARGFAEQAMQVSSDHGDLPGRGFAAIVLAFVARRDGEPDVAEEMLHGLIAAVRSDSGEIPLILPTLQVELGYILQERDPAAALALQLEAFDGAQRIAAPRDTAYALAGLAAATTALGEFDAAAQLLGAAATVRENNGMPLLPSERPDIDRATAAVRQAIGDAAFASAHAAGTRLQPAAAAALAAKSATAR